MAKEFEYIKRGKIRFKCYKNSSIVFNEIWNYGVYDIPNFKIKKRMNIIDIGANQGFFSIYAARYGANVYAFEPDNDNLKLLKWNISKNKFNDLIRVLPFAVSDVDGKIPLYIPYKCKRKTFVMSTSRSYFKKYKKMWFKNGYYKRLVNSISLSSIFKKLKIKKCHLLKIDCQGAEYGILKYAPKSILDKIERIVVETHKGYKEIELLKILSSVRFKIILYEEGKKDKYGDGLIKAIKIK